MSKNTIFLTAKEVESAIYQEGDSEEIFREAGEPYRWVTPMTSIIKRKGIYLLLWWKRANTECQEDEFYDQEAIILTRESRKVTYEEVSYSSICSEKPLNIVVSREEI